MTQISLTDNEKKPTHKKIAKNFFKFLVPLLVLFIYTAIMAGIFYAIEKDCSLVFKCPATFITVRTHVDQIPVGKQVATTIGWNGSTTTSDWASTEEQYYNKTTTATPIKYETVTRTEYIVAKNKTDKAAWSHLTYFVAFHFVFISITTIGYGDIYPCSVGGELLTIFFTLVGIPITLMALTRTAKIFALGLHKVWLFTYMKRKKPPYTSKQRRYIDNKAYVPVLWGVAATCIWILISAEYFFLTLFNDYNPDPDTPPFTYFLAFYFTMISFLTIGFGDYAPIRYDLIFVTMIFLVIGLSLVTLCIDLAQLEFDIFFDDVVDMIEDQYKITLDNDEQEMHTDHEEGVKQIVNTRGSTSKKVMKSLMSNKAQEDLHIAHEERAKLASKSIQNLVTVEDREIQALIKEELVDFGCQFDIPESDYETEREIQDKQKNRKTSKPKNLSPRKWQ